MASRAKLLLIGLDPSVVDYSRVPGLTPEKLQKALESDISKLNAEGYEASICFIDHGDTAEATVASALASGGYHCILIGAGVRADPNEFLLFEKLINLIHSQASSAKICFNTGPSDSADAFKRWV
jgi:hypothetical protein